MQNSFSLQRLGLLIKKQWYDNAKLYTLSLLALTGVLIITFICWASFNESNRFEEEETFAIFATFLFAVGLILASTTFNSLSDKAKGTYWLTVPATHLEKLLCGILYSVVFYLLVYVLIFVIVQQATFFSIGLNPKNSIEKVKLTWKGVQVIFLIFIAVQSLFVLGSVYFERFAFVKTILAALLIFFAYTLIFQFGVKNLFDHSSLQMRGLTSFAIWGEIETKIYRLSSWLDNGVEQLLKYIWAPVLLVAAYFRLREKEL